MKKKHLPIIGIAVLIIAIFIYRSFVSPSIDYEYYDHELGLECAGLDEQVVDDYQEYLSKAEACDIPKELDESYFEDGFIIMHTMFMYDDSRVTVSLNDYSSTDTARIRLFIKKRYPLQTSGDLRLYVFKFQEEELDKEDFEIYYKFD